MINKNMKYIIVKHDMNFGGGIYSTARINAGKYPADEFKSKYPFFDFTNKSYFEITEYEPLKRGTKVIFEGQCYYIEFADNVKTEKYNGKEYTFGRYNLYKSMTNKKSFKRSVYETEFEICAEYYFINSEGALCKAYVGQKPEADKFRKHIGNYFETEIECRNVITKLKFRGAELKIFV